MARQADFEKITKNGRRYMITWQVGGLEAPTGARVKAVGEAGNNLVFDQSGTEQDLERLKSDARESVTKHAYES
jgi:hypothetical protein